MTNQTELKTASVLAFERKLDVSDALMFSGIWENRDEPDAWQPVVVREKSVRGTISNRLKTKDQDPAKLDAAIENPNLQTVDVATLPSDNDTLMVRFTVRVLAGAGIPSACNNAAYQAKLKGVVESYVSTYGFGALAQRYATNLANGRFLWRNRFGAEQVEVQVRVISKGDIQKSWVFDALASSLRDFSTGGDNPKGLEEMSDYVEQGLAGQQHVLLEVLAFSRIGAGQEVFPSQELILDRGRGDKSRTLYDVNKTAGIHSQKLGNAIRTIDTWYPEDSDDMGPIAVEPYGSVTTQGKAYRQPKQKADFYSLLDSWVLKDKTPEEGDQHFVIATLIRGGVFGEAG